MHLQAVNPHEVFLTGSIMHNTLAYFLVHGHFGHRVFPPLLVPDPPIIDLSGSKVYNEASICWRLPEDHLPTDHHILEYRRLVESKRK